MSFPRSIAIVTAICVVLVLPLPMAGWHPCAAVEVSRRGKMPLHSGVLSRGHDYTITPLATRVPPILKWRRRTLLFARANGGYVHSRRVRWLQDGSCNSHILLVDSFAGKSEAADNRAQYLFQRLRSGCLPPVINCRAPVRVRRLTVPASEKASSNRPILYPRTAAGRSAGC